MTDRRIVVGGIIDSINYGTVMQALAMNDFLGQFGRVEFIDYKRPWYRPDQWEKYVLRDRRYRPEVNVARVILQAQKRRRAKVIFSDFIRENLLLTDAAPYVSGLGPMDPEAIYCVGSDQTWNYEYNGYKLDPVYCLLNVPDEYTKMALSASIGRSSIPEYEGALLHEALKGFRAISVRERSSVDLLAGIGIRGAVALADPVILCNPSLWKSIGVRRKDLPDNYILCYQLNDNRAMVAYASRLSRELNMPVVRIEYDWRRLSPKGWKRMLLPTVPEWVGMFQGATQVVTDSFHGLCFSMLNHKPMTVFDPPSYSIRLVDALSEFGISDRRVTRDGETFLDGPWQRDVDWTVLDAMLERQRSNAFSFINAIVGE